MGHAGGHLADRGHFFTHGQLFHHGPGAREILDNALATAKGAFIIINSSSREQHINTSAIRLGKFYLQIFHIALSEQGLIIVVEIVFILEDIEKMQVGGLLGWIAQHLKAGVVNSQDLVGGIAEIDHVFGMIKQMPEFFFRLRKFVCPGRHHLFQVQIHLLQLVGCCFQLVISLFQAPGLFVNRLVTLNTFMIIKSHGRQRDHEGGISAAGNRRQGVP